MSDPEREMSKISRRSFLWAGAAIAGTAGLLRWIATRARDGNVPYPLRNALDANAELSRKVFDPDRLAPTYPASTADPTPRLNTSIGVVPFNEADYRVRVERSETVDELPLEEIRSWPKTELTMDLHCIEGWTTRVAWGGVPFTELARRFPPGDGDRFVYAETPGGGYCVSLDLESALHPQTLLCYEMNGEPLKPEHGAPIRLVVPVKYGIKHLKQLGTVRYTKELPPDYWAEQGYDWYAGL